MARSVFNSWAVDAPTGQPAGGAIVSVTNTLGAPIALYDARTGGTALGNPYTTELSGDEAGKITFYADPQRVNIVVTRSAIDTSVIAEFNDHLLIDEKATDPEFFTGSVQTIPTFADLATTVVQEGQTVYLNEYNEGTGAGVGALTAYADAGAANNGTSSSTATAGILLKRPYPDVLTPLMFGADPTDIAVDDYDAFAEMMDVAENEDRAIFIPDSLNYFIDQPLTAFQGLRMVGLQEASAAPTLGGGGAKIYAPNGFLTAASRMSIYIENLYLLGNSGAGIYGVEGPIGGVIKGCYSGAYERCISNNFAYFLTFLRCRFGASDIGIAMAVANATDIIDCFFESGCEIKIDSGWTITTAFDGATNIGGAPLNIRDCGFNINTTSGAVAIRHMGSGDISNNYFEVFTGAGTGREMIHWKPRRDAYDTVKCNDNRVSNQGQCDRFLRLWSDNALGTVTSGEVKRNTVRGCTSKPFIFGDIAGLANPLVSGIDISSNNYDNVDQIDYTSVFNYFYPQIQGSFSGSLSIAGATFANVTLVVDSGSLGGEAVGDDIYPRVAGYYSVVATVVVQTTASDYPDVQARLRKTGAVLDTARAALTYNAATSYATLTMTALTNVTISDFFELQARQGETLISAKITIKRER
jgi:hypothetical protein